jgi:hypothetical protein
MRLRELQGYRNDPGYQQLLKTKQIDMDDIDAYPDAEGISDSFNDFIEIAKKNGWHFKGQGYFGSVLHKPGSKYVYKIYYDDDNTFRKYVNWARVQKDNPYVPKVGKVTLVPGTKDIYVTKMELLEPTAGRNDPRFQKYINPEAANAWFAERGFGGEKFPLFDQMMASLRQTDPHFEAIAEFAEKTGHLDLHYNNVMFRGDQLIVIDPVS